MRKRPAIPRLDGGPQTILLVDDVERSVEFYGQSLMLRQTDADPGRYAEFDTGDGCALVLLRREGSIAPIAVPVFSTPLAQTYAPAPPFPASAASTAAMSCEAVKGLVSMAVAPSFSATCR